MRPTVLLLCLLPTACWPYIAKPYDEAVADLGDADTDTDTDTDSDTDVDTAEGVRLTALVSRYDYLGDYWQDGAPSAIGGLVWLAERDDDFDAGDVFIDGGTGCVVDADLQPWFDRGDGTVGSTPAELTAGVSAQPVRWDATVGGWLDDVPAAPLLPETRLGLDQIAVDDAVFSADDFGRLPRDVAFDDIGIYDRSEAPSGSASLLNVDWTPWFRDGVDYVHVQIDFVNIDAGRVVRSVDCIEDVERGQIRIPNNTWDGVLGDYWRVSFGSVAVARVPLDGVDTEAVVVTERARVGALFRQ